MAIAKTREMETRKIIRPGPVVRAVADPVGISERIQRERKKPNMAPMAERPRRHRHTMSAPPMSPHTIMMMSNTTARLFPKRSVPWWTSIATMME